MAERQDLPNRPQPKAEWSMRRLFGGGIGAISTAFTKVFVSPFEWLLTFSMVVIAIGELGDFNLSGFFYWVSAVLLACVILRRAFSAMGELPDEAVNVVDHSKKK